MMAAQLGMLGMPNGELALHEPKIEPLENNSELGVYLKQTNQDGDGARDIYFAQFSPKQRFLAMAGSGFMAYLWDLRGDDYSDSKLSEIPHVRSTEQDNQDTAVSAVHWNMAGDKLLTSSSDMVARVWKVDPEGKVDIYQCKNFNECLMQSKFCYEADNLVATGGLMS